MSTSKRTAKGTTAANQTGEPRPDALLQIGFAFWSTKALLSAVELGVFTELAKQPLDGGTLAARCGLHARSSRDFLDALVALKVLERDGSGVYRNTSETDYFLDKSKSTYIGGIFEMISGRLYPAWGRLTEGLKTGSSQNELKGVETFQELYADPARLKQFLSAMTGLSLNSARAIARKFPWRDYKTFIDVGCAQGAAPAQIAMAHPHLRGSGFDLPVVRPIFEEYIGSLTLADRVKFIPGDFFKEPLPSGADVIIMGHILHDWALPEKRQLIAKAYDALPRGGAFVVYESLIDDERRTNAQGLLMSLNMLIETPGGFDYTGADCQGWMAEAGFTETWVEPLDGPTGMVVGIK
jgi:SAM-dependent methyltransferase